MIPGHGCAEPPHPQSLTETGAPPSPGTVGTGMSASCENSPQPILLPKGNRPDTVLQPRPEKAPCLSAFLRCGLYQGQRWLS